MVDALQPALREAAVQPRENTVSPHTDVTVAPFDAAALEFYAEFCREAVFAPHQCPLWLQAWGQETGAEMLAITVGRAPQPQFVLVVEIVRQGIFRVARFPGGRHANGNFPATARTLAGAPAAADGMAAALRSARPDVDLVSLERLEPLEDGIANPLLRLATGTSPNVALSVDLAGGFEALLERRSGKRKRKKHRSQVRKYEEAGGYRLIRAQTSDEVDALLSAFFAMRQERFRRIGARDTFAEPEVRAFLHGLYREALDTPSPRFVLDGLEVGGQIHAVAGGNVLGARMTCDFTAMDEGDIASASPGEFLFFELIRKACEDGLAVFDFSVGDEPYKRLWCDIETRQSDLFLPLSARGRAMALAQRRLAATKQAIKNNPLAWKLAKSLRRGVAGQKSTAEDEE